MTEGKDKLKKTLSWPTIGIYVTGEEETSH